MYFSLKRQVEKTHLCPRSPKMARAQGAHFLTANQSLFVASSVFIEGIAKQSNRPVIPQFRQGLMLGQLERTREARLWPEMLPVPLALFR